MKEEQQTSARLHMDFHRPCTAPQPPQNHKPAPPVHQPQVMLHLSIGAFFLHERATPPAA